MLRSFSWQCLSQSLASWMKPTAEGVNSLVGENLGVLVITHYQRMLNFLKPDFVHIMYQGRIVETGQAELALRLEESGYDWIREVYGESGNGND